MAAVTIIRTATGFLVLNDDATGTVLDLTKTPTGATQALTPDQQAQVAAIHAQGDDSSGEAFIRAQLPARVAKAKAVIADPSGSPAWTAMETKVILALVVLDITKRMR